MGKKYYKVKLYTKGEREVNTHSIPEDEAGSLKEAAEESKDNDEMLKNPVVKADVKLEKEEVSPREEKVVKEKEVKF